MTSEERIRGNCVFCGAGMTRGGFSRHLTACARYKAAIAAAEQSKDGVRQQIFHLQVQDRFDGNYWLHLEMNGESHLKDLDRYLRAIWLECCYHLSRFSVGGGWDGREVSMRAITKRTLSPGLVLTHIYDFGTSSETQVKVVGARTGKPLSQHPIFLMARNLPIEVPCQVCGESAQWLCIECQIEHNTPGFLCHRHAEGHPHVNYGEPMMVVNSPRMGMCGYSGPALPPY